MLSLTIKGERQLRQVSDALKRGKGTLRSELTKAFRDAGQATLKQVKRNVETMQIRGRKHGGRTFREVRPGTNIRQRISRVTELQVTTGANDPRVSFVVKTDRLGDARNLPWHLDSGKIFRHPIMGNRSAWAGQSGKPWFYSEIKKNRDAFVDECDKAIQRTIDRIEKG